jgi:hypothetical protein
MASSDATEHPHRTPSLSILLQDFYIATTSTSLTAQVLERQAQQDPSVQSIHG